MKNKSVLVVDHIGSVFGQGIKAQVTVVCRPTQPDSWKRFSKGDRFYLEESETWQSLQDSLPPFGEPFQAYHPDWIDEDFNIHGIRECHRYGDGSQYYSAVWFDYQDCWVRSDDTPLYWKAYSPPKFS